MRVKTRYILSFAALVAAIVTIVIFQLSKQENQIHKTDVNESIVQIKSFIVNSDSTELNTSAKGTLFVSGREGMIEHVQIVASIEIDPNDWGGVAFYIPDKWYVSNIKSSYPENKPQSKPVDDVSTWTTADDNEWKAWIEVGRDRGYRATGGGTGTVVIDLVPDKSVNDQTETYFSVEVGSSAKDGIKVMGTDFIKIPITLTDNE